jgi:hypothetical protein
MNGRRKWCRGAALVVEDESVSNPVVLIRNTMLTKLKRTDGVKEC